MMDQARCERLLDGVHEAMPAILKGTDMPVPGWAIEGDDDFVTRTRKRLGDNFDLPRHPSIRAIAGAVADLTDITVAEMQGRRKSLGWVRPRQLAMYLMQEIRPDLYLTDIGRFFNRDHTTVIHAIAVTKKLLSESVDWHDIHERARAAVTGYPHYTPYPRFARAGNRAGKV